VLPAGKVHVVEVDGFGNLITDAALPRSAVRIAGHEVAVGRTFGDVPPGGLVIYEDSAGDVAVARNGGSAAALLGVRAGDELELR
jgi:S-adenosylmethionine hydrolase